MPTVNSIKQIRGRQPLLVHGVSRRELKCTFKSKPFFSDKSYKLSDITKDESGNPLGNCIVRLFDSSTDQLISKVESDSNGNFSFLISPGISCYYVMYKGGATPVAGTSLRTLAAS